MRARRAVLALLVLAAVTAGVVLLRDGDGTERLSTGMSSGSSAVVADGTRVTATGRVVAVPDRPVRFCAPVLTTDVGYRPGQEPAPEHCEAGVDVEGVDLEALADRREKAGAVEGYASLTGTYDGGTLAVDAQAPPPPPRSDVLSDTQEPPCEAPEGGWPRDPRLLHGPGWPDEGDANMLAEEPAMHRYRAAHPGDVVTLALLRPYPDAVLMGVAVRDAAAAQRAEQALRPTYGVRLCVVQSRFSREQVAAAQAEFEFGSPEAARLGVLASGEGVSDELQPEVVFDVVMVTDELVRRVSEHPDGLIALSPWLTPVEP